MRRKYGKTSGLMKRKIGKIRKHVERLDEQGKTKFRR
jgi:hypothetical protein